MSTEFLLSLLKNRNLALREVQFLNRIALEKGAGVIYNLFCQESEATIFLYKLL